MSKIRFLTVILILTLWFSNVVPTALAAPSLGKIAPDNGATGIAATSVKLSWGTVQDYTGSVTYRYCLQTKAKCPPGKWVRVGSATSVIVKNLKPNTKYNWWVRAYTSQGTLLAEADGGASWNFTTLALPGSFNKLGPANNSTGVLATGVQLSWGTNSSNADHYEYCLDTVSNNRCDTQWITATSPVTLTSLHLNTVYYWQVRAVNGSGSTTANNGTWWVFTTQTSSNVFEKLWPPDAATNQPATGLGLSWMISPNATYRYCVSTSNNSCSSTPTGWVPVGTATSATVPGTLTYSTQYYWQVEAVYTNGSTPANGGTWWRLTTQDAPPADFNKINPTDTSTNLYTDVTFTWQPSAGASYYEFCISDTNNDTTCGDAPWDIVNSTSYTVYGLDLGINYYWQVRAVNNTATVESNAGIWWTFQTQPNPPAGFTKSSPANGATKTAYTLNLVWNPTTTTGVTYQVCYDTTDDAICDSDAWHTAPSGTSYNVSNLAHGARYYWQVRATNSGGTAYADGDQAAWWNFTTLPDAPVSSDLTLYDIPEDQTVSNAVLGADTTGWTFSLYGSAPAGTLDFQPSGHFTYNPVANANGPVTFKFRVSDGVNTPAGPYTVTMNYVPVNDPPQLGTGGGAIIFPAALPSGIPWKITLTATDVDTPASQLTFSGTNLPAGASIVSTTGVLSWTPIYVKGGTNTHTFTITVSDGDLSASQDVTIMVVPQSMFLPIITRN